MRTLFGVVLVVSACGAPEAGVGAATWDSAGIQVVESHAPAGADWALSADPVVSIGSANDDPHQQLYRVNGIARLADGRIVVANAGFHEVRLFDGGGRFLRRMGGRGSGPGEFEELTGVMLRGDSVVTYDQGLGRLSVFDAEGQFQRSAPAALPDGRPPLAVFPLDTGRLVARAGNRYGADATAGIKRDSAAIFIMDYDGTVVGTVGTFASFERLVVQRSNSMTVTGAAFGRSTSVAAHAGALYVGDNARWEVAVRSADGSLRRLVRVVREPERVTESDIATYRERRLAGQAANAATATRELLDAMAFPQTFPAYAGILVDVRGYLWVREYTTQGRVPQRWLVFGSDGQWRTGITTPAGFTAYKIGDDYVLGRWTDADGVEFVHLYALTRAP